MPEKEPRAPTSADCAEKKLKKAPGRNSWTLSWLAEMADGWRGEELLLTRHPAHGLRVRRSTEPKGEDEEDVCKIETPKCQPDRKEVRAVTLDVDGTSAKIDTDDGSDAVFWTESAVEKFLYPYYHSHRLWDERMDRVKRAFETYPDAYAIKHKAPSSSFVMSLAETLQIGALNLDKRFVWLAVDEFLALVEQYLTARGAGPAGGDREQGSREPAGAR